MSLTKREGKNMQYRKIIFSLLAAVILALFCWPSAVLAQDPKTDLQLYVSGGFPGTLTAGKETHFYLTLKNNGDTIISGISFSHDAPQDVQVSFDPDSVASLTAGSSNSVDVTVTAGKSSGSRDYNINLIANSPQTRAVTTLYFRVQGGSSYWTWVGLGLGLIVVIGFILVYRRLSK
jgi:uncharacterized membrane protein